LHTNALDEALGLPTPETARLALRTQQVLASESGVAATVDPLAGSYYVESLTDEIAERSLAELASIDDRGGTLAALADGYQPDAIGDAAYEVQRALEAGERITVGLNAFTDEGDEQRPAPQEIGPELEARQVERTRAVRARRDASAADEAVRALEGAAAGTENVLPRIRAAVEADVTLGEISHALRRVWGEHRP
ncbi:MAG TPA: methylmalonyl-CoA mutase family protein, partial [Methylomirabilota bacterium]|nr:methylmalonyl-CoA mutase family protein [Methylomirabilota bacterium]